MLPDFFIFNTIVGIGERIARKVLGKYRKFSVAVRALFAMFHVDYYKISTILFIFGENVGK